MKKYCDKIKYIFTYLVKNNLVTSCLSAVAIIISIISLNRSNDTLIPKFSLVVSQKDTNSYNRILKIYNCGGQLISPQIEPKFFLDVNYSNLDNTLNPKKGHLLIEFPDYFQNNSSYPFNYNESVFVIDETKADKIYTFIKTLNDVMKKETKFYVTSYSMKYYFYISFYNYRNKKTEQILEVLNNYIYIFYRQNQNKQVRYFNDTELKQKKSIELANIVMPTDLDEKDKFVFMYNDVNNNKRKTDNKFKTLDEFILYNIVPIIDSNLQEIKVRENGTMFLGDVDMVIDNNWAVGYKTKDYKDSYKKVYIIILSCFIILLDS